MEMMILGLILFLGSHSVGIFAPLWREKTVGKIGLNPYKGITSLVALAGIILIVKGHDNALDSLTWGWAPPLFTKHLTVLLMLFALIMLVSSFVPNNHIKAKLKHPMILGVKIWAFSHLICNGEGANVILFGSFLVWAVLDFRSVRQKDRLASQADTVNHFPGVADQTINSAPIPQPSTFNTLLCIVLGALIWLALVAYLHNLLFGVYPILIPGVIGPGLAPAAAAVVMPT